MAIYNGPFPANITSAFDEILVSHTTFSGGVTNTGTIGSGGISVVSGAFLSGGGILDLGIVSGAIKVDSRSKIVANPSFAAITVATPTFAGGISNAGTLSALHGQGIFVSRVAVFGDSNGGGITNSGTIAGEVNAGIFVNATSTFAGGISNRGQIIAAGSFVGTGINVENVGNFAGGIANSGTISATIKGIEAFSVSTLTGNLVNTGKIVANDGIGVVQCGIVSGGIQVSSNGTISAAVAVFAANTASFGGGITNRGKLIDSFAGISVNNVAVFGNASAGGGITNSGTVSVNPGLGVGGIAIELGHDRSFIANIVNFGAIVAKTAISISDSTIVGAIVASGTIVATSQAIVIDNSSRFWRARPRSTSRGRLSPAASPTSA